MTPAKRQAPAPLLEGMGTPLLESRGLTHATAQRFGVQWAHVKGGEPVVIFPYHDEHGSVVGQKIRGKDKSFSVRGNISGRLFGAQLCGNGGRMVVVTEGEYDALAVDQATASPSGRRYGACSVPNGAQGARKALLENLSWLNSFEKVVLCFDMDEPGRAAIKECVGLFPPGKVAVAALPLKDANEMLLAGRERELYDAIWNAPVHRPDGIVTIDDVWQQAMEKPKQGLPWIFDELTKWTYGRRYGEIVGLGAGTGVGKTTFLTQQIAADLDAGHKVGAFLLEQNVAETVQRVAGQMVGKLFHLPDGAPLSEMEPVKPRMEGLYLYDNFGVCDWSTIKERIRWLRFTHGVRLFYLDNLTALAAADAENERTLLETLMGELSGLMKELDAWLIYVSHLTTPEKGSHEEGARVKGNQFKGSRSIQFWSHFLLGLERDQQAEGSEGQETVLRILKDRYTGRGNGKTIHYTYDFSTGLLVPQGAFAPITGAF